MAVDVVIQHSLEDAHGDDPRPPPWRANRAIAGDRGRGRAEAGDQPITAVSETVTMLVLSISRKILEFSKT